MFMDKSKKNVFGKYAASPDPVYVYEYRDLVRSEIRDCLSCVRFLMRSQSTKIIMFSASSFLVQ